MEVCGGKEREREMMRERVSEFFLKICVIQNPCGERETHHHTYTYILYIFEFEILEIQIETIEFTIETTTSNFSNFHHKIIYIETFKHIYRYR